MAKKESDKPKRAPTAYFIFLAEFREQMKGKKLDDNQKIPALAGEKWRTMTDKDKEKYKELESAAKKKHEGAMEEWRKKVHAEMSGLYFVSDFKNEIIMSALPDAVKSRISELGSLQSQFAIGSFVFFFNKCLFV